MGAEAPPREQYYAKLFVEWKKCLQRRALRVSSGDLLICLLVYARNRLSTDILHASSAHP